MSGSMFCAMTHVPRMFEEGTLYAPLHRMLVQSGFQNEITCMYCQWGAHWPFSEIVKGCKQERGQMQSMWKINNRSV